MFSDIFCFLTTIYKLFLDFFFIVKKLGFLIENQSNLLFDLVVVSAIQAELFLYDQLNGIIESKA